LPSRRIIVICGLLAVLGFAWLTWRGLSSRSSLRDPPAPTINKQPVSFASRVFDPAAPPADMPPLALGEDAECDSDFISSASVSGESQQTDATHATVTITEVRVTLQLNITIWLPAGVAPHVIEHEQGHRQIEIAGTNLNAESSKMLRQMATEFTDEYNRELSPGPAQLLYDAITNHGRNQVIVKDAVAAALKNVKIASTRPAANPRI